MAVTNDQTKSVKSETAESAKPANIAPAKGIDPSGAPQQIVPDVDMSHPAVDDNPRANTSVDANRIDFNDPTIKGHDAVAEALNAQGVPTRTGAEAAASVKAGK